MLGSLDYFNYTGYFVSWLYRTDCFILIFIRLVVSYFIGFRKTTVFFCYNDSGSPLSYRMRTLWNSIFITPKFKSPFLFYSSGLHRSSAYTHGPLYVCTLVIYRSDFKLTISAAMVRLFFFLGSKALSRK